MKRLLAAVLSLLLIFGLVPPSFAVPVDSVWDYYLMDICSSTQDDSARKHVFVVDQKAEALGVELKTEALYYDGEVLDLCWRTNNLLAETPALVLYTQVMVDGVPVDAVADFPVSLWTPSVFGLFMAGDPINNLMWSCRVDAKEKAWKGEVEVTASFVVKRPTKPMVVVDPEIHVPYADASTETDRQATMAAMEAHGVTIAPLENMDPLSWQKKGYLVVNRYGEHFLADELVGRAALTGSDLPDCQSEEVTMTFRVNLNDLV